MRKVLMISYVWPPMEGVGLIRALKFAKYLPEYGWQPLILTVKADNLRLQADAGLPPSAKVFRTEYRDVISDFRNFLFRMARRDMGGSKDAGLKTTHERKGNFIMSVARELIAMPDDQIGWYRYAVEGGMKVIQNEKIDLIFSTSPPETAHLVARMLKKRHKIPWVADLRDLWSEDHFRSRPLLKRLALKLMEKNVLKDADALITVSEPWADRLRSTSGAENRVRVIENGHDDADFNTQDYKKNEKFTITYTGKLHKKYQPVEPFFKALKMIVEDGRIDRNRIEARFHVLGYDRPDISGLARKYGLTDIVKEAMKVGYGKSLEIQRSSDALLFIQWKARGGDGWYSAKIYDYIGARRPILALAEKGSVVDSLIKKTSSGVVAYDEKAIRDALIGLYNEFLKNGFVRYGGNEKEITGLSRRLRTKELSELFDSVASGTCSGA